MPGTIRTAEWTLPPGKYFIGGAGFLSQLDDANAFPHITNDENGDEDAWCGEGKPFGMGADGYWPDADLGPSLAISMGDFEYVHFLGHVGGKKVPGGSDLSRYSLLIIAAVHLDEAKVKKEE